MERVVANLTEQERDAVLAGLRVLQRAAQKSDPLLDDILEIFTNGFSHDPLALKEIDALCERINIAPQHVHSWESRGAIANVDIEECECGAQQSISYEQDGWEIVEFIPHTKADDEEEV